MGYTGEQLYKFYDLTDMTLITARPGHILGSLPTNKQNIWIQESSTNLLAI